MKLLTKAIERKLLKNGENPKNDITKEKVVVKLFAPSGSATWWLYSMNKNGDCFGIAKIFETEYGYFNINEISELRVNPLTLKCGNTNGLPVERDMYYTPETFGELL
tara:strand:- start:219 stop:539 length:321 start_codon:yes stop_codon:yes gene_type:complete